MEIKSDSRGITLVELVIAVALLSVVLSGAYFFLDYSAKTFRDMEAQYIAMEDARRALISIEEDIRRARSVNYGGVIHKAVELQDSGMGLNVYTDIDHDDVVEIVQYRLEDNQLKKRCGELGEVPGEWTILVGRVRNELVNPAEPVFSITDTVVGIHIIITDEKERIKDLPVSISTSITVRSKGAMD